MAFLSEMLGRPVTDIDGKLIGTLKDVIAKQMQEFPHPLIQAILVSRKGETLTVNYSAVASLMSPVITLMKRVEDLRPYLGHEEDIFLSRDVLDKQIIDTDGARVVRVNDVELMRVNGTIYVGNVDIGAAGILRRVGLARAARWLKLRPNPISWNNVELLRRALAMDSSVAFMWRLSSILSSREPSTSAMARCSGMEGKTNFNLLSVLPESSPNVVPEALDFRYSAFALRR